MDRQPIVGRMNERHRQPEVWMYMCFVHIFARQRASEPARSCDFGSSRFDRFAHIFKLENFGGTVLAVLGFGVALQAFFRAELLLADWTAHR
mmetsp:Transcript_3457/g.10610  ORF Transcript_3457/g.10610 Transcript_3457/m.10610 type:complete len:92 (-) Transcript_3457:490-765(-)